MTNLRTYTPSPLTCLGFAVFLVISLGLGLSSTAYAQGPSEGLDGSLLLECPKSPNCVSSQATDAKHAIVPFSFSREPKDIVGILKSIVTQMDRVTVISETETYLHVEFRSRIFQFVDDVEFKIDASSRTIQIRSASRVGYSDWGVNRKRVEDLRNRVLGKI